MGALTRVSLGPAQPMAGHVGYRGGHAPDDALGELALAIRREVFGQWRLTGPQRCHWGTDVTNSLARATYRMRRAFAAAPTL